MILIIGETNIPGLYAVGDAVDYEGKVPVVIGLLKGSVPFMAELIKHISIDCEMEFMAVSSYSGTESMGDVKIVKDLDRSIKGCDVLIVEDIVDTGKTLEKVKELLYSKGAEDVKVVTANDDARVFLSGVLEGMVAPHNIECDEENDIVTIKTDNKDVKLYNRLRLLEQFAPYKIGG